MDLKVSEEFSIISGRYNEFGYIHTLPKALTVAIARQDRVRQPPFWMTGCIRPDRPAENLPQSAPFRSPGVFYLVLALNCLLYILERPPRFLSHRLGLWVSQPSSLFRVAEEDDGIATIRRWAKWTIRWINFSQDEQSIYTKKTSV